MHWSYSLAWHDYSLCGIVGDYQDSGFHAVTIYCAWHNALIDLKEHYGDREIENFIYHYLCILCIYIFVYINRDFIQWLTWSEIQWNKPKWYLLFFILIFIFLILVPYCIGDNVASNKEFTGLFYRHEGHDNLGDNLWNGTLCHGIREYCMAQKRYLYKVRVDVIFETVLRI